MANLERLEKNIADLKAITDPCNGGVTRIGFTPTYREGVEYIKKEMREAGLEVSEDDIGNVYGRLAGKNPLLPAIVSGSHLDTVRNAGAYDGIAGVVAALEVARMLREQNIRLEHPYEVVAFIEEEGTRFGIVLLGSRFISGELTDSDRDKICTDDGETLRDILRTYSAGQTLIPAPRAPDTIKAFIELHDEQGPLLENSGTDIGIVDNIVAIGQMVVTIEGVAGHAGTVPMKMRQDAGVAGNMLAARLTQYVIDRHPDTATLTIGKFHLEPGSANCIPSGCRFTLDIRSGRPERVHEIIAFVKSESLTVAERCGVTIDAQQTSFKPPVEMNSALKEIIKSSCEQCGLSYRSMSSGAGHDAMIMADISKAAMLFVPCVKGITHNPAEFVHRENMGKGTDVLFNAIQKIDRL
ncbi:Zn-dependent hydrolase [Intestinirhabdus alba]|jgi:allantoate deiminase|uniref:Hydantoinase/carbamoylase family amidase n=1 Tax=Intestinirhabdus alba TaxID=2899544 RepID=A0A6L6IK91_9ENTR|nr:Zn-dependent hydrolase [Intestinirhabdus alba]MTH47272.1 hydantoinase/carbamoylase family amidase [Intestinirhabdus alba]